MILWLIALFLVACVAIVGYYQGALRAAFHEHFVGLLRVLIGGGDVGVLADTALPGVHLLQQITAITEAIDGESFGEFEPA